MFRALNVRNQRTGCVGRFVKLWMVGEVMVGGSHWFVDMYIVSWKVKGIGGGRKGTC